MSADWTTCRVVRDRAGHAVTVVGVTAMHLTGPRAGLLVHVDRLAEFGPLTPVLDADGLPVVRTVGDLTLRQLRARPQIRLRVGDEVGTLYAGGSLKLVTHDGRGLAVPVTLDTPCTLLPREGGES